MGYDRGDSFPFNFEPNGFPFGSENRKENRIERKIESKIEWKPRVTIKLFVYSVGVCPRVYYSVYVSVLRNSAKIIFSLRGIL